jgi:MOSC domain-containing protein YiiM
MRLVSVQVGKVREVVDRGRAVRTAIYKEPVHLRVRARTLGLEGDTQADQRVHGGPDKAVYAYDLSRYAHWKRELGADFLPGQFGENLTVEGMPDTQISLGDVYRVGSALLQVTEPRGPCFKLAMKMKHPDSRGCSSRAAGPASTRACGKKASSAPAMRSRRIRSPSKSVCVRSMEADRRLRRRTRLRTAQRVERNWK